MKLKQIVEYVILEKLKDEIDIRPATREEVDPFVQKHYLGDWPTSVQFIYAVYWKKPEGEQIIGTAIYGAPFHTAGKFIAQLVQHKEIIELKRLFILDGVPLRNLESYVIAATLKLVQKDMPNLKMMITFADDKVGHKGTIYQATNAIYLGQTADGKHKYVYPIGREADKIRAALKPKEYPKGPKVATTGDEIKL